MKFLHIADLHLGKSVNDFSMLEDQEFILKQIIGMAKENQADAVVMAGDIYDRAIPPGEAVILLDSFLTQLRQAGILVLMISGNHDSPERLSFGGSLFQGQGVHIAGVYKDSLEKVTFQEGECITEFVLMPFCKPSWQGAGSSGEAVKLLLENFWRQEEADKAAGRKNYVLVTHFFVTNKGKEPELSDSESTIHVGGLDNVDVSLFQGFDYVALGHIHKPQQIGEYPVWYAGSPLKYSFGETKQEKGALLVCLDGKGLREVKKLPLRPCREMRKIRGSLKEIMEEAAGIMEECRQDYIQAVLTDKGELIDPIGVLRGKYPNVMQILREDVKGCRGTEEREKHEGRMLAGKRDVPALFEAFYREVREEELSEAGKKVILDIARNR